MGLACLIPVLDVALPQKSAAIPAVLGRRIVVDPRAAGHGVLLDISNRPGLSWELGWLSASLHDGVPGGGAERELLRPLGAGAYYAFGTGAAGQGLVGRGSGGKGPVGRGDEVKGRDA